MDALHQSKLPPHSRDESDVPPLRSRPLLAFDDVRKHFRLGEEVIRAVDGVTLTVGAGEIVALYGPSGSGKSTLMRIAAGVEAPDSGKVTVDGIDVTALSQKESAAYRLNVVGWISQDTHLVEGTTALDNAAFKRLGAGRRLRDARRDVAPLLQALGLGDRAGQRVEHMSMGERQRVVVARALSLDPRVLLADEPTGHLDRRRTSETLALLRETTHARGIATLLVTHDEHAMDYADKVYTLQDGVLHAAAPGAVPRP
ncbi:MAG TPA: ABC transporter ATP-binding protein [Baekduia sp.]